MGRSQRHLREIQGIDSAGEVDAGNPAAQPQFQTTATVTGTAKVGQTLTATPPVVWSSTPVVVTHSWYADAAVIAGATGTTYVPVTGDIGKVIKYRATASNAAGTATNESAATAAVVA